MLMGTGRNIEYIHGGHGGGTYSTTSLVYHALLRELPGAFSARLAVGNEQDLLWLERLGSGGHTTTRSTVLTGGKRDWHEGEMLLWPKYVQRSSLRRDEARMTCGQSQSKLEPRWAQRC